MRYTSSIASVAALVSIAAAGDAPVVQGNPLDITFAATIPQKNAEDLSGAIKLSAAPDGEGVNVQFSLYNVPASGDLSYGLYGGNVASLSDCSTAGGILNPYGGFTGDRCKSDKAGCAIGALSDKYGPIELLTGGSGTGYFADTYIDKYLSVVEGDEAYFGSGSFIVTDSSGAAVACANFVNPEEGAAKESKQAAHHATQTTAQSSASASAGANGGDSTSTEDGSAMQTQAPILAAGIVGLAALLL